MTIKKQRAYSLDDVPQTIARTPAVAMPIAEPVIRVAFATSLTTTTTTTTAKTYRLSIAIGLLTARPSVSVRVAASGVGFCGLGLRDCALKLGFRMI